MLTIEISLYTYFIVIFILLEIYLPCASEFYLTRIKRIFEKKVTTSSLESASMVCHFVFFSFLYKLNQREYMPP